MVMAQAERRQERDKKLIKLKEHWLTIERSRAQNEAKNNNSVYDFQVEQNQLDQRRLDLDIQKFELEISEIMAPIEQSKQLTTFISKLVDKLD